MKKVKLSDDLLPNWLKDDNEKRTTEYARNISDEKFLYYLNEILAKETIPITKRKSYPIIFFFGLPRCGKTFFSQMLVHALDLGYPDNIIAKFWKSPYFGIRLSRILQRSFDKSISCTSDFGKTANLFDPHDFAYYWQWLLRMEHFPYDPKPAKKKIDWENLKNELILFTSTFSKACVFKGVNPSFHMADIFKIYPQSFFIYLERDLIDSAVSLRKGRLKNYNDVNEWYGQVPNQEVYLKLKDLPYYEQIGGQFKYLIEMFEEELSKINGKNILRLNYNYFCNNSNEVMELISNRIAECFNYDLQIKKKIDENDIKFSKHDESLPFYKELQDGLKKFNLDEKLVN